MVLTDQELEKVYSGKYILCLFTSKSAKNFTKNVSDFLKDEKNNINCLCCDIAGFNKMVATHDRSFSLLHLNISSLLYHLGK